MSNEAKKGVEKAVVASKEGVGGELRGEGLEVVGEIKHGRLT